MPETTVNAAIFIVHPDENQVRAICDLLSSAGHCVSVITTAVAARQLILKSPPDIVITSPQMKHGQAPFTQWLVDQKGMDTETLLLVDQTEIPDAIRLVEQCVIYDYLVINPLYDLQHLRLAVQKVLELRALRRNLLGFQHEIARLHREEIPQVLREHSVELTTGISGDLARIEGVAEEDQALELSDTARRVLAELGLYRETGLAGRVEESAATTKGSLERSLHHLETSYCDRLIQNAPPALGGSPAFRSPVPPLLDGQTFFASALTLIPNRHSEWMMQGILQSCGLQVFRARTIDDVVELVKRRKMELVVLEIDSYLAEWRDYIARFRAFTSTREGVLMVLTSQPTPELIQTLVQQRVDEILAMPLAPELVSNKIQQVLSARFQRAVALPAPATARRPRVFR